MSFERYETNPFTRDMVIPVKGKRIQLSPLGSENNVLINQGTGEIYGTHVTSFKKVDEEQFVKLFTRNIGMTFELSSSGIKVFSVLVWAVQSKALMKDEVILDSQTLKEFIKIHNESWDMVTKISLATFKRGLNELEKAKIIAKTTRKGIYFINPNFIFNGDRVAFTTLLERSRD